MTASSRVIVLGAGGNSLGILDAMEACNVQEPGRYEIVGILDDIPDNLGRRVLGHEVLGTIADAPRHAGCSFINGISSIGSFREMPHIVQRAAVAPERFVSVVHPRATVAPTARIGRGSCVLAGSVLAPMAVVGDHVIILQNTSVNHHSNVGDYVTLSAGITILGYVDIGRNAFVGGGSTLAPRLSIGESAVVGAGSLVIRDVPPGRVYAGNPAHELANNQYARDARPS